MYIGTDLTTFNLKDAQARRSETRWSDEGG